MRSKKILAALMLLSALLLFTEADARTVEIRLKRVAPEERAIGYLTIRQEGFVPFHRELRVFLHRLEPNSVYTVWLTDPYSGERTPPGLTGENRFITDGGGNASYAAVTDEFTLGWKYIEIAMHPDKDPSNTEDMVVVLRARLYQ